MSALFLSLLRYLLGYYDRGDLVKDRIHSTNTPDLTDVHDSPPQTLNREDPSEKENAQPKAKGRGRPSGKTTQPDQLIKPTNASLTPRYVFLFYGLLHI